MRILFFGDVYGQPGREALKRVLPKHIRAFKPDFTIANVENMNHGRGMTAPYVDELRAAGIDAMTSGNNAFATSESITYLGTPNILVIRPANYPDIVPGRGWLLLEKGKHRLFVTNLLGRIFMGDPPDSPFTKAEELIAQAKKLHVKHIFVDMHAEATSEKAALGVALDGRTSAVVGTHTHVQTADERLLPGGTAFITDVGFCGPWDSVIGAEKEGALRRFQTGVGPRPEVAPAGRVWVNGVAIETDDATGLATRIERVCEVVEL